MPTICPFTLVLVISMMAKILNSSAKSFGRLIFSRKSSTHASITTEGYTKCSEVDMPAGR